MISKTNFPIAGNDRHCVIITGNETGVKNGVIASTAEGFTITFDQSIKELVSCFFMLEGQIATFTPVLDAAKRVINVNIEDSLGDPVPLLTQKLHIILVIKIV
jgi:hypothetical protein